MAANPSGQGFQNKNRVAILAELDKEKRKLLMQTNLQQIILELALPSPDLHLIRTSRIMQSSSLWQPSRRQLCSTLTHVHLDTSLLKTASGNLILPVLLCLDPE
uniref:SOSS complex subunit C n=1 Tax=Sciurus vulgaris TaxID=55149 RepID=A0A8D2CSR8_SCIVU